MNLITELARAEATIRQRDAEIERSRIERDTLCAEIRQGDVEIEHRADR